MNLISRSCLDGFMCKYILSKPNNNPFIWNIILLDSYKNLIENYDSINFRNIKPNKSNKTHRDMLDEPRQLVEYMKSNNVI